MQFVRGLSANVRDLSAIKMQLNRGQVLKNIDTKSAIQVQRDSGMADFDLPVCLRRPFVARFRRNQVQMAELPGAVGVPEDHL